MDQKEIDALINQGSVAEYNKKQEDLWRHLVDKSPVPPINNAGTGASVAPHEESDLECTPPNELLTPNDGYTSASTTERKGKVMGQLSRVTEESEAGTNMVMGFMENVLSVVSKQQSFIKDIAQMYAENPSVIDVNEALSFVNDNLATIEELIFSAMDAFQFQDIGRQKLMKVMYTLAKLNEYLNELLGGDAERNKAFGHKIEKKTLEHDKEKKEVDSIVASFQPENTPPVQATPKTTEADTHTFDKIDVDNLVAQFKAKDTPKPQTSSVENKDIDSIIAEFQKQNK